MVCAFFFRYEKKMKYIEKIEHAFSEEGWLSQKIKGFRPRSAQLKMAQAVGNAVRFAKTYKISYLIEISPQFKKRLNIKVKWRY